MLRTNFSDLLKSKMLLGMLLEQNTDKPKRIFFVNVDPQKISHISIIPDDTRHVFGPEAVYGSFTGSFDLLKYPFKKDFMYHTVYQILNGVKAEETPYFAKLEKRKDRITALKHINKLKRLIRNLSDQGYLSQYQLGRANLTRRLAHCEVPKHEMIIGMDREGQLFRLRGGRHRLAIAQNIGIREIPAILSIYHENAEQLLPEKKRAIVGKADDFIPF